MRCPTWINDEGKRYWQRNASELIEEGILTDATSDKFALLCEVWGLMRTAKPDADSKERVWFIGLLKQFQSLEKQFRTEGKVKSIDDIIGEGLGNYGSVAGG